MADTQVFTPQADGYQRRRFTFDEFWKLWEDGTLEAGQPGDRRFELWDGEIYIVPPPGTPHDIAHSNLLMRLSAQLMSMGLYPHLRVIVGGGLRVDRDSYLIPDLYVLEDSPAQDMRYPPLGEVRLVVETSFTSLRDDLGPKREAYAAAGIPEYWVQDVEARCLHVHRAPADRAYAEHLTLDASHEVSPLFAPALRLPVAGLF